MLGITLKDTVGMMNSSDYRERFIAEYWQTKIRYEKLKAFNTKIDAAGATDRSDAPVKVEEPKHDCPWQVLEKQEVLMRDYLHVLEVRAVIEGIDLDLPFKVCACCEAKEVK